MKLTIPLQSLLNPEYSRFANICSRVRAAFLQLDESQRHEIMFYLHGENLEYVENVLPFHAITRSVVTEISRMMCEIQGIQFKGLEPYQNETWYPSIELGLDFNNVQFEEFFEMDLDVDRNDPSLNRTALLQYMIDNGQNVLTVEIQK
jgi:hypothetical protein